MSIIFNETNISGLFTAKPHSFSDERGDYIKYYERDSFCKIGITDEISESSEITSLKGVMRGLHFQTGKSQIKIAHVVKGSVFDVCVDLREKSNTFGRVFYQTLSAEQKDMLIIPAGFAHGFLALQDCVFSYSCIGKYEPALCHAIKWDDPELCIPWPKLDIGNLIVSEKDNNAMSFQQYCSDFTGK